MKKFDFTYQHGKDKWKLEDKDHFMSLFQRIEDKGKQPIIFLTYEGEKRSNEFNRFYFGVIVQRIASHTGETKYEVHETLKSQLLGWVQYENMFGEIEWRRRSTRYLSSDEFRDYCDRSMAIGMQIGVDFTDLIENVEQHLT